MSNGYSRRDFFRVLLGSGIALGVAVAGCDGNHDPEKQQTNTQTPKQVSIDNAIVEYFNEAMSKFTGEQSMGGLHMLLRIDEEFPDSPLAHFLAGNVVCSNLQLDQEQRYRKTIEKYSRAITLDKNFAEAYVNRGAMYFLSVEPSVEEVNRMMESGKITELPTFRREAYKKALEDFDRATKLEHNLFSAHFNKGLALMYSNKEREAIKEFSKAIETGLRNESWEGYVPKIQDENVIEVILGDCPVCLVSGYLKYVLDNYLDRKRDDHRVALQGDVLIYIQDENDPEAFANFFMGSCYAHQNIREYSKAIAHYSRAIELNPNVPRFYQYLALVQTGTNQLFEALQTHQKIFEVIEKINRLGVEGN